MATKVGTVTDGRRPDPTAFLLRGDAGAAGADDPLRAVKRKAVKSARYDGADMFDAVRGLKSAVTDASRKLKTIGANPRLTEVGRREASDQVRLDLIEQGKQTLATIENAKPEAMVAPGLTVVGDLTSAQIAVLHFGTSEQVLALLDGADGDESINNALWIAHALFGGRLANVPERGRIGAAMSRAELRMSNSHDYLSAQYLSAATERLTHLTHLLTGELVRQGYLDPAYQATGTFRILDEPDETIDLADHFDWMVAQAATPFASPLVLQSDGTLAPQGAPGSSEAVGPVQLGASDRGSRGT